MKLLKVVCVRYQGSWSESRWIWRRYALVPSPLCESFCTNCSYRILITKPIAMLHEAAWSHAAPACVLSHSSCLSPCTVRDQGGPRNMPLIWNPVQTKEISAPWRIWTHLGRNRLLDSFHQQPWSFSQLFHIYPCLCAYLFLWNSKEISHLSSVTLEAN